MSAPLLQLSGVVRSFPSGNGEAVVLKGIDLAIAAGEMVAIVGASGAGKSMLVNILGCLDRPTSGRYTVAGVDVGGLDRDELARLRREHFGFVFQRYHLMQHLDAIGNVEVPAIYAGMARRERRERAAHLLARLGLGDGAQRRPSQLSGGQQQRVSIARALMNGGQVLLADEPTGALDRETGAEVLGILRELHAQGHTVILVTHDMTVARAAGRIIVIDDGRIVADDPNLPAAPAPIATLPAPARPRPSTAANEWERFVEALRAARLSLAAHRMRTALTMLGVVIGITSVVSISALGEGAKQQMLADIRSVGALTLEVYPGRSQSDDGAAGVRTLLPADLDILRSQPYARAVTPLTTRQQRLRFRNVDVNAIVNGVGEAFFHVRDLHLERGAAFLADDVRAQRQVVVIDAATRSKLFGATTDPIGRVVLVGSLPCTVVGVTEQKKGMGPESRNLNVWLPYTTAGNKLFGQQYFDSISVRVRQDQSAKAAEDSTARLLTLTHGTKDFFIFNMDSVFRATERAGKSLTLLLSLVAAISLVVGGIGVMNVMLVSVTERTREIGIRIAVGARQADVLQQFLTEAVAVCLAGGLVGALLSCGVGFVFTQWPMVYSTGAFVSAFACATLTGVVFGYVPARNAARLDPVDALARE